MIAATGSRRVPISTAFMHSERFVVMWPQRRPSSTCFIHRSLRNDKAHACMSTECASRHCKLRWSQVFPSGISKPRHEVLPHVPDVVGMVRTRRGPPVPLVVKCGSDRIRPVGNDHETLLGSDMSSQVRQEE
ncbi:hypothetical protein PIB30_062141 [Stylosanthes scabra]|uniref:Uncharacterized protein n=1 Tax=Stylosanthes scabra TaxID=79078 RepID=A0ABU6RM76_9FABA|nr:hypothetical protein [Stylosanthes scabra]